MGDPRKQRKKFEKPSHPWQKERIDVERGIVEKYGLKNKKELWKAGTILKNFKQQTKELIRRKGEPQAEKEANALVEKLVRMHLLEKDAKLEEILDLGMESVLERRLQTQLLKQGLAKSTKQARQFIIHGHVLVKGRKMDVPSYLLAREEESALAFSASSALANPEHPERKAEGKKEEPAKQKSPEKTEPARQKAHARQKAPEGKGVAAKVEGVE
ncbi:30S ribosomal protein S4 [Candidatus Woesearchaeota archaeon]|nr:30S ribosomal protein S4 [Candidatus Woesearchaeota archaeon]